MIKSGLVSITLRKLTPAEIVRLAGDANLQGIEWGGDIHVPHGSVNIARDVSRMTLDAGLEVAAYGSYYRMGRQSNDSEFERVLDTAVALKSPLIRVWAGQSASAKTTEHIHQEIAEDGHRISELAVQARIRVACEWHSNSLTDTTESAKALLDAIPNADFGTYWQPRADESCDSNMAGLHAVQPRLMGLHVFHWDAAGNRLPLSDGEQAWKRYLRRVAKTGMYALLEFVAGDDPAQMARDAAVLNSWLNEANQ